MTSAPVPVPDLEPNIASTPFEHSVGSAFNPFLKEIYGLQGDQELPLEFEFDDEGGIPTPVLMSIQIQRWVNRPRSGKDIEHHSITDIENLLSSNKFIFTDYKGNQWMVSAAPSTGQSVKYKNQRYKRHEREVAKKVGETYSKLAQSKILSANTDDENKRKRYKITRYIP